MVAETKGWELGSRHLRWNRPARVGKGFKGAEYYDGKFGQGAGENRQKSWGRKKLGNSGEGNRSN